MTFEEAKKSIRWILTVSHPIGSWELENIMDALDITPCDISTCKVAKALWGNKGNIPDIDISRVKNGTPLEAQQNRCNSCIHSEEQDGSNCYECVKGMADNFEAQPTNGDIFKTIFSNLRICENRDNKDYPYVEVFIGEHDSTCYPKEWWNAPYREGDNDAEH